MTKPIRIFGQDKDDDAVRARHEEIEKRLSEIGAERVKLMMAHASFPTEWNPIIFAWLAGDKLEKETKKRGDD